MTRNNYGLILTACEPEKIHKVLALVHGYSITIALQLGASVVSRYDLPLPQV